MGLVDVREGKAEKTEKRAVMKQNKTKQKEY